MKRILPVICLVFTAGNIFAQAPSTTLDTANHRFPALSKNSFLLQGTYSHSTPRGKVHILPYDNMPCLVPDMNQVAPMPGSVEKVPDSRMPNAIPRQDLIPRKQKPSSK